MNFCVDEDDIGEYEANVMMSKTHRQVDGIIQHIHQTANNHKLIMDPHYFFQELYERLPKEFPNLQAAKAWEERILDFVSDKIAERTSK